MAEKLYFVRKRGEISAAAFTVDELKGMRDRGLFARFDEVSIDQVKWMPAVSVQGLFSGAATARSQPVADDPPPLEVGGVQVVPTVCEQAVNPSPEWYYLDAYDLNAGDSWKGPVSLQDLQRMLAAGQVDAETPVCQSGMPQWVPLGAVPELGMSAPAAGSMVPAAPGSPANSSLVTGLLTAVVGVPILGMAVVSVLAYLAVREFLQSNQAGGVLYAFLGLIVFLLAGVGTVLLVVICRRHAAKVQNK